MDTLRYTKMIEQTGLTRRQAEVQVQVLGEVIVDNLVTKQNLKDTKNELQTELRDTKNELQQDLKDVASELRTEIKDFEVKMDKKFVSFENRMVLQMEKIPNQVIARLGGLILVILALVEGYSRLFS